MFSTTVIEEDNYQGKRCGGWQYIHVLKRSDVPKCPPENVFWPPNVTIIAYFLVFFSAIRGTMKMTHGSTMDQNENLSVMPCKIFSSVSPCLRLLN